MRAAVESKAVAPEAVVVSVSKGLEEKTLKPLNEIIAEELRLPAAQITTFSPVPAMPKWFRQSADRAP